jgi:hypothetical protein
VELLSLAGPLRSLSLPGADADKPSHKGFGFATFHALSGEEGLLLTVKYACSLLNGIQLAGRRLAVRPATLGTPAEWLGEVAVRQLNPAVDADMLGDIFACCGLVANVRVLERSNSPGGVHSAFVSFKSRSSAARSLRIMDGLPLFGQPISVSWSRHHRESVASASGIRSALLATKSLQPEHSHSLSHSDLDSCSSRSGDEEGGAADDEASSRTEVDFIEGDNVALDTAPAQAPPGSTGPPEHSAAQEHPASAPRVVAVVTRCMRDRARLVLAWDCASTHSLRCEGSMPSLPPLHLRIVTAPHGALPVDRPYAFQHGSPPAAFVALGVCCARRAVEELLLQSRQGSVTAQVRSRSPPPHPPQPPPPLLRV